MPSQNTRKFMPDNNLVLVSKNLKQFYYWMFERQNIWYKRFALKEKQPWTKDKILQDYKFTNVYRELDRNTIWLINNVIKDKSLTNKEMFWKIVVFRYFNKPELFEYIGGIPELKEFTFKDFFRKVNDYKQKEGRVFTDAYMINPPKKKEDRDLGIEGFYCKNVRDFKDRIDEIWNVYKNSVKPKEFIEILKTLNCVADFIAYEIYCDLTYTDWFKYTDLDYVNVGPGAKFGLELIFPKLYLNRKEKRYLEKLNFLKDNFERFMKLLNYDFKYYNVKNLLDYKNGKKIGLRCIEHSLCEYSKYWKMKINVGKPRQKFVPKTKKF